MSQGDFAIRNQPGDFAAWSASFDHPATELASARVLLLVPGWSCSGVTTVTETRPLCGHNLCQRCCVPTRPPCLSASILSFTLVTLLTLNGGAAAQTNIKVIRAARLFNVRSGQYLLKPTVLTQGEHIKEIAFGGQAVEGAEIIDVGSMTLFPGLIDCHTHLLSDINPANGENESDAYLTAVMMSPAQRALRGSMMARAWWFPLGRSPRSPASPGVRRPVTRQS